MAKTFKCELGWAPASSTSGEISSLCRSGGACQQLAPNDVGAVFQT